MAHQWSGSPTVPVFDGMTKRGVWIAPWLGRNGETILVAVTRHQREVRTIYVPPGISPQAATDELWAALLREDPGPVG